MRKKELISKLPKLNNWIKPYYGSNELIKSKERYCLWLKNAPREILDIPEIKQRLNSVKESRLKSPTKLYKEFATKPNVFIEDRQPSTDFLAIPEVSSEKRQYVPISLLSKDIIVSNKIFYIPTDSKYILGLLLSQFHNAWIRTVAGRLEMRYSYSPAVYNSFVFPQATPTQRQQIEACAQAVLDARGAHQGKSLAQLYDPDLMPHDLATAHAQLDSAVEAAYGVNFNGDEEKIIAHLFELYEQLTCS